MTIYQLQYKCKNLLTEMTLAHSNMGSHSNRSEKGSHNCEIQLTLLGLGFFKSYKTGPLLLKNLALMTERLKKSVCKLPNCVLVRNNC